MGDLSPVLNFHDGSLPLYSITHLSVTAYDEASACIMAKKDTTEVLKKQVEAYRMQGMPEHYGLYENNIFLINPNNDCTCELFLQWWKEYEMYSKRDQISLPYILYKNNMKTGVLFDKDFFFKKNSIICFLTHIETNLCAV